MGREFIYPENGEPRPNNQPPCSLRAVRLFVLVVLALAAGVSLSACKDRGAEVTVELPATTIIAVRPEWATAVESYVRLHGQPDTTSSVEGHLRAGDVVRVLEVNFGASYRGERPLWCRVEVDGLTGWAPGPALQFFGTRARAENASRLLINHGESDG